MKKEFLQAIHIGDDPLPDEAVEMIWGEVEKIQGKADDLEKQLTAANKQIEEFKGMDIDGVRKAADEWKAKAEKAEQDFNQRIADMEYNGKLKDAIVAAKGKNPKAIMALLDHDTLRASKNQDADIAAAIEQTKKENDYMFESETPPRYAAGTGTQNMTQDPLAASIRSAMGLKGE